MAKIYSSDAKIILNRVKKFLGVHTDLELAEVLGITSSAISQWKTKNYINWDLIFEKCQDINYHWLMTGEGPMKAGSPWVLEEKVIYEDSGPTILVKELRKFADYFINEQIRHEYLEILTLIEKKLDERSRTSQKEDSEAVVQIQKKLETITSEKENLEDVIYKLLDILKKNEVLNEDDAEQLSAQLMMNRV